jgi:hypothetical protein
MVRADIIFFHFAFSLIIHRVSLKLSLITILNETHQNTKMFIYIIIT